MSRVVIDIFRQQLMTIALRLGSPVRFCDVSYTTGLDAIRTLCSLNYDEVSTTTIEEVLNLRPYLAYTEFSVSQSMPIVQQFIAHVADNGLIDNMLTCGHRKSARKGFDHLWYCPCAQDSNATKMAALRWKDLFKGRDLRPWPLAELESELEAQNQPPQAAADDPPEIDVKVLRQPASIEYLVSIGLGSYFGPANLASLLREKTTDLFTTEIVTTEAEEAAKYAKTRMSPSKISSPEI